MADTNHLPDPPAVFTEKSRVEMTVLHDRVIAALGELAQFIETVNVLNPVAERMLCNIAEYALELVRHTDAEFITVGRPERGWEEELKVDVELPWA